MILNFKKKTAVFQVHIRRETTGKLWANGRDEV